MSAYYGDIDALPPIGKSDHSVIICKLTPSESYRSPVVAEVLKHNASALNKVCFIEALSEVHWECLYRVATCAEQYQIFKATISTLLDEYLPFKTTEHCTSDQFRYLIRKRQQAFLRGKTALFHFYRNKTNREAKRLQKAYYQRHLEGLNSRSSKWWADVKEITGASLSGCGLQSLANQECGGDMKGLVGRINSFPGTLCLSRIRTT